MISVNSRILSKKTSGVQRYLQSILREWQSIGYGNWSEVFPRSFVEGHLWEQFVLGANNSKSGVLWSPSNTGPLHFRGTQVVTIHDLATIEHPEWTSKSFSAFYRFLLPRICKKADRIIAISDFTKQRIVDRFHIEESKIKVIHNGVDFAFFNKLSGDDERILRKYGIPVGRRYVLSVSSIEPRKNIKSILQAWSLIVDDIDDDIFLLFVGPSNPRIFADVDLKNVPDRVFFSGFVEDCDLPVIYQRAFIFIYLPLYEGFGLPPLEAMAAGVPVLTSNVASIPEVVGRSAVTVDPKSILSVCESWRELVSDVKFREQLIHSGIEQAKSFSWHDTAQQTYDYLVDSQ